MANLREIATGSVRPVSARLLVGRGPSAALRIDHPHVSSEHASIVWTRGGWTVRDLGSRNGTFVDGKRIPPGEPCELMSGARIGFGSSDPQWELADDGPPAALALDLQTGAIVPASSGLLALPEPSAPRCVVLRDARGRYVAERDDGSTVVVQDGEVLTVDGRAFRVHVPVAVEGTAAVDSGPSLASCRLRFAVSRNEEHVEMTLLHRGQAIPLDPREHGYILLTLARARVEDAELPLAEQGWVERDELLKMLGIDTNTLNVAIYRARAQLLEAGIEDAASIVDVRRGARRFGIEPGQVEIVAL